MKHIKRKRTHKLLRLDSVLSAFDNILEKCEAELRRHSEDSYDFVYHKTAVFMLSQIALAHASYTVAAFVLMLESPYSPCLASS